jgi:hypothetical protein
MAASISKRTCRWHWTCSQHDNNDASLIFNWQHDLNTHGSERIWSMCLFSETCQGYTDNVTSVRISCLSRSVSQHETYKSITKNNQSFRSCLPKFSITWSIIEGYRFVSSRRFSSSSKSLPSHRFVCRYPWYTNEYCSRLFCKMISRESSILSRRVAAYAVIFVHWKLSTYSIERVCVIFTHD